MDDGLLFDAIADELSTTVLSDVLDGSGCREQAMCDRCGTARSSLGGHTLSCHPVV